MFSLFLEKCTRTKHFAQNTFVGDDECMNSQRHTHHCVVTIVSAFHLHLVLLIVQMVEVLLARPVLGEEMHRGELDDGREHEDERHRCEDVECRRVRHFGQVLPVVYAEESHCEHRGGS